MFQDAEEKPRTLHDLCQALETSVHEIELKCVECKKTLQRSEVYDFTFADLRIVYRDGNPFAVCKVCLRLLSKISEYRHYNYSLYGNTLEQTLKKRLEEILIRCIICQRPLCPQEKKRHVDLNKRFHNISGRWTGRCAVCWRPRRRQTQV
uniref:Protein E6 n=1 Tax=Human papillomavirus 58 TaxID=10598 RepID=Q9IZG5_HPV58|nr:E6 protein [human papillomavirus 58]AFY09748.1 E6 [human papillomavirus 58]WAB53474.1 E6 [human papillomavirus 58]